jgi:hypothetical protein
MAAPVLKTVVYFRHDTLDDSASTGIGAASREHSQA